MASKKANPDAPQLAFKRPGDFTAWLEKNHARSAGFWMRLAKRSTGISSVTYDEAVESALCFGWIDGQKRPLDEEFWLQKFAPRKPRSLWSKRNRDKVAALIKSGRMRPAGLAAVEKAKQGGQWQGAYDSPKNSGVPADFQAELAKSKAAAAFFAALNGANRYAMLWRIQTAKRPETRARRIRDFIAMLKKKEKLYP